MLVAVITTKLRSLTLMRADEKLKTIMKLLRFIIILMMYGSDAECSDLYHQRTWFRCSACCSVSEHWKRPSFAHVHRVLGPLSSTNTIPMLGYVTTAIHLSSLNGTAPAYLNAAFILSRSQHNIHRSSRK